MLARNVGMKSLGKKKTKKTDYHIINKLQPKNSDGLTDLEEQFCYLYVADSRYQGKPTKIIVDIKYSPHIVEDTDETIKQTVADEILRKKHIKKRIAELVNDRDGQYVYDRLSVMENYKKVLELSLGEHLSGEEKENFVPDLKTAKNVLDSMAKTLGMLQTVEVKQDTVDSPQDKLKRAFKLGQKRRAELKFAKLSKEENGTD